MKKVETPSDTVFEEGLKEILSSGSQDYDQESDTESEPQAPITSSRPRLDFSASSREAQKLGRVEVIIRVIAGIAALGLLIYFAVSITSKM